MTMIGNYTSDKANSMIALFKAIPYDAHDEKMSAASLEDCILRGFVFVDQDGNVMKSVSLPLFVLAENNYGIDKKVNNQTFWKSFERVRDMDPCEYVLHQVMHYFSTYGLEMIGEKAQPYVPVQDLDIPETMLPFKRMTIIRTVDGKEMSDLIDHFAETVTAPSKKMVDLFKPLMGYISIDTDEIKSFELQVVKHDMDGTVPAAPQSFLRYLVYKTTGSTMIIKNRDMRKSIQYAALDANKANMPHDLLSKADLPALASIFFRFKPIFLAYKKFEGCAPIINHIRRLADQYHKPLGDVSVQNFINLALQHRVSDMEVVLKKASNRELVKLCNALSAAIARANGNEAPAVYNVRNGRSFVRADIKANEDKAATLRDVYGRVKRTLVNRIKPVLNGKMFYIPNYIDYMTPVTEKQFIGNIPWGTVIDTFDADQAFTIGVSWFDQKGVRTDIDLHLNSIGKHYGWNGGYMDGDNIIYTGDQTAASEGAAEAYYFTPGEEKFVASVNLYAGIPETPFKMYMTSKKPVFQSFGWQGSDYTFDPADAMFAPIPLQFPKDSNGMTLGMFSNRMFYFYGGGISRGIVPSGNYEDYIKGLNARLDSMMDLHSLLVACGAVVLNDEDFAEMDEEDRKKIISLAPEDLTATTLLDIVDGNV